MTDRESHESGPAANVRVLFIPSDARLPCFSYGFLKAGELAYRQIADLVDDVQNDTVRGSLSVRDGLPLLRLDDHCNEIFGTTARFREARATEAYVRIGLFEPKAHYKWSTTTTSRGNLVNVLEGRSHENAQDRSFIQAYEYQLWKSADDPLFTFAIPLIQNQIERLCGEEFHFLLGSQENWERYFSIQMSYLLLWSVIERYTALSFGPSLDPSERVGKLAEDPAFHSAISDNELPSGAVYDSRNPKVRYLPTSDNPKATFNYFYTIRSNISHRGKGAFREAERVRIALVSLFRVTKAMLDTRLSLG